MEKPHHVIQVPLSRFSRVQSQAAKDAKLLGHDMGPFETGKYKKCVSKCRKCKTQIIIRWDEDYTHDPKITQYPKTECTTS